MGYKTREQRLVDLTYAVYVLQALGFVTLVTFFIAAGINLVRARDVRDTWLAPHFRWQLRTFWSGLLLAAAGLLTLQYLVGYVILLVAGGWVLYRIIVGATHLKHQRAPYPALAREPRAP